jgi:hypothetical protein
MKFAEMKFSGYKLREEAHSFTGLMTKTSESETSEFDSVIDGEPIAYYPLYDLPIVFWGHIYLFQLRDSTEYPDLGFKVNSKANTLVLSSKESTPFCLRSINSENYSETKSYSLFEMSQRSAWLVGKSHNLFFWLGNYFTGKFQHFFFHDIKFCHELKRIEGDFIYECYPFCHPFIESFNNAIYNNSAVSSWDRFDELFTLDVQTETEVFPYLPIPSDSIVKINPQDGTATFVPPLPDIPYHTVEFGFTQPFGLYNWEIFFHMPFTLAVRLSQNKQFEQAQRWFHYIFNPLKPVNVEDDNYTNEADRKAASYWNFWPLHQLGMPPKVDEKEMEARAIEAAKDPFNPHRIARARLGAYQKAVVIKYLDNLIAWGDHLFQQDTLETINEATHLYILAAKILGPRPKVMPKSQSLTATQPSTPALSEAELSPGGTEAVATDQSPIPGIPCDPTLGELNSYSKQLVDLDQLTWVDEQHLSAASLKGISSGISQVISAQVFLTAYSTSSQSDAEPQTLQSNEPAFCIPHNDHLLSYWDTVADRLFKIRNCRNIAGEVRELPIFEPPIDPALLVRGVALNVDISELLSDLYTPLPPLTRVGF